MRRALIGGLLWLACAGPLDAQAGLAGTEEARAAADRMIERLGGRAVWARARSLQVVERAHHVRYGGPLHAEFWRDLEEPVHRARITGQGLDRITAWDREHGWQVREGQTTFMHRDDIATEVAGWRQEPYRIYHQLAAGDPELRIALLDGGSRLVVFDRQGRTLCWFLLDASGGPLKWGNVFEGRINEHTYGPLVPFGPFWMPAWGVSADGSWRFEYVSVTASDQRLQLPTPPGREP